MVKPTTASALSDTTLQQAVEATRIHTLSRLTTCFLFAPPTVSNYTFDKSKQCISTMTVEIDFLQKKHTDSRAYDSDKMAAEFLESFNNQAFSVGQQVLQALVLHCKNTHFYLETVKPCCPLCLSSSLSEQLVLSFSDKLFSLLVKYMEAMDPSILKGGYGSGKKQKVLTRHEASSLCIQAPSSYIQLLSDDSYV